MSSCRNGNTRKKHINRINRIKGQIQAINKMLEEDRPCEEILRLVAAAKGAIGSLGLAILEEHMQGCVTEAVQDRENHQDKIHEAMALFAKFSN